MAEQSEETVVPWRACCGQRHLGPLCPDNRVMCCLCFDRFDVEDLAFAPDGSGRESVCKPCAWRDGPSLVIAWMASLSGSVTPPKDDGLPTKGAANHGTVDA